MHFEVCYVASLPSNDSRTLKKLGEKKGKKEREQKELIRYERRDSILHLEVSRYIVYLVTKIFSKTPIFLWIISASGVPGNCGAMS